MFCLCDTCDHSRGNSKRSFALVTIYPPPCLWHELECLGSLRCCSESSFSLDFLDLRDHTPRYPNLPDLLGSIGDTQKQP